MLWSLSISPREPASIACEVSTCLSRQIFVATNIILSRQKFRRDKHTSVATKDVYFRDKTFVATKVVYCHDKTFVATKTIVVAATANKHLKRNEEVLQPKLHHGRLHFKRIFCRVAQK